MNGALRLLVATMILSAAGCATQFTGESHVPGGPAGCEAKCKSWGLDFVGMVAMGEYSDACICRRPGAQSALLENGGEAGGAAGVVMQMRRAEQQRAQASMAR
jgi:hypothetical protein